MQQSAPDLLPWAEVIRLLTPSIRRHKKAIGSLFLLLLITVSYSYISPLLQRYFVDQVLIAKAMDKFLPMLLILGGCLLVNLAAQSLQFFYNNRLSASIALELQQYFTNHLIRLPSDFFDAAGSAYLSSRFTRDLSDIRVLYSGTIFNIAAIVLQFLGGSLFLCYFEWRLFLLAIAAAVLLYAINRIFVRKQFQLAWKQQEANAVTNGKLQESFNNIKLVKSSAREERAQQTLVNHYAEIYKLTLSSINLVMIRRELIRSIPLCCRGLLLAGGAWYVVKGELTLGALLAIQSYFNLLLQPAVNLGYMECNLQQARAAAARLRALEKQLPEVNLETGRKLTHIKGEINIQSVSFRYRNGCQVFQNLSLHIRPGEKTVIVGGSGSGKSTLAALLIGLYRPDSGTILLDGINLEEINLKSLRDKIGFISTRPQLMDDTLRANLTFGNEQIPDETILECIRKTASEDLLDALEKGLDSKIGEGGERLSAGQRLRITIIRELLRNVDMMILDEPTSTLDGVLEKQLTELIDKEFHGKTLLIVTHRPALMYNAERILLFDHGAILADGSYAELKRTSDAFRKLLPNLDSNGQ